MRRFDLAVWLLLLFTFLTGDRTRIILIASRNVLDEPAGQSSTQAHVNRPSLLGVQPPPVAPAAPGQVTGISGIHIVGQPILVFDHLVDRRETYNIPDLATTAWKEPDGTVNVMVISFENYRMRGPDLEHVVSFPNRIFSSTTSASDIVESHYNYRHWLAAPYTLDGQTVYSLAHSEWYACLSVGDCATTTSSGSYQLNSWANTLTSFLSTDGGASWAINGQDEAHVVSNESFTWTGSLPLASTVYRKALNHSGMMQPSRIIREGNYFYSIAFLVHRDFNRIDATTGQAPVDRYDYVLMRTTDLTRVSGWEAWVAGSQFVPLTTHAFTAFSPRSNGVAMNAAPPQIIFDTNAKLYIAAFVTYTQRQTRGPVYYMTTPSLASPVWSEPVPINGTATVQIDPRSDASTMSCNHGFTDGNYVSLIDTHSEGLNFEFTDGDPWLFYVFNPALACGGNNLDRDLFRLKLAVDYK